MANRVFNQLAGALEKNVVKLYARIAFAGGTSNPVITGKGFTSCVYHSATGLFKITLQDKYKKLLAFQGSMYKHDAVPTASSFSLSHVDVDQDTPTIDFYAMSGVTGVNPGNDETAYIEITLGNSSV